MNKYIELRKLSEKFYLEYPFNRFPEIERKNKRPYVVLLVKVHNNIFALPFRTNIKHSYCYKFKNSNRLTFSSTGIDYTKAVVINNKEYLGDNCTIDDKEYLELKKKFFFIIKQFKKYIDGFYKYCNGNNDKYLAKKYKFSTLNYFKESLDIDCLDLSTKNNRVGIINDKKHDLSLEEFDSIITFSDEDIEK